jgi:hypothetical protein
MAVVGITLETGVALRQTWRSIRYASVVTAAPSRTQSFISEIMPERA